ncbi:MAG: GTPase RsgA, partial [Clostridia bacterium]|nr:GTPase RsgA [Clostridia bacterium]
MQEGTIIRGRGGLYTVRSQEGQEYILRAKKKFRRLGLTPLVGDNILFTPVTGSDEHGWVEDILERNSAFIRPPVANVSLMAIVVAPRPEPDYLLIDRLLVFVQEQKLRAEIVVNKCDLDETAFQTIQEQYVRADAPIYAVSAQTGQGLPALENSFSGQTVCFCGQSGVGKSTLLNAL